MRRRKEQDYRDFLEEEAQAAILEQDRTLAAAKVRDIAADFVLKTLFDAHTILAAIADDTPAALTIAEQRLVGRITSGNITGLTATQVRTLINVADGADVTGDNAPKAHKDSHDPQDGSDKLDCGVPANITHVQAAAEGTVHFFARSSHQHGILHAITDNALVTVDGTTNAPANLDYAKWTTLGLEGRSYAQVLSDIAAAAAALSNLASVAINTSLLSDTDDTDDLGSEAVRWRDAWVSHGLNIESGADDDHEVSGIQAELTAGENLVWGNFCYVDDTDTPVGKMKKTDADAESSSRCIAFCTETVNDDASGTFLLQGFIRDDTWTWTAGARIYLSTTAGAVTATAPSGTDDCIVVVGIAMSDDEIYFNPSVQAIVEHT